MKALFTLIMACALSFNVLAADLKSQDVEKLLKSMPILEPWLEKHEAAISANMSQPDNPEVMFEEAIPALKKAGLYDELNSKVKKLGYKNVEQWNQQSQQVMFAWMALEMEANKAQIDAAKAQYEAMKANPDIPASQKAMMEQMMAPALAMVKLANQSSAADKAAVKPHKETLKNHFDRELDEQ
jgi:hypothetical protein